MPEPIRDPDVEPRLLVDGLLDDGEDVVLEGEPVPVEPPEDEGVRLMREVEFRKACDPPPTFWPFVDVIEGAADAEEVSPDIPLLLLLLPPLLLPPPPLDEPVPRD